jgi:hypothetical protein
VTPAYLIIIHGIAVRGSPRQTLHPSSLGGRLQGNFRRLLVSFHHAEILVVLLLKSPAPRRLHILTCSHTIE